MVEQIPLKDKVAGSRPAGRTTSLDVQAMRCEAHAEVAKLVDALALGASGVTHGGPNPLLGTTWEIASKKGSPRFARRLIGIQFSGQKRIGGFAKYGSSRCFSEMLSLQSDWERKAD